MDIEYVGMKGISEVALTLQKILQMPLNTAEELSLLSPGKVYLSGFACKIGSLYSYSIDSN